MTSQEKIFRHLSETTKLLDDYAYKKFDNPIYSVCYQLPCIANSKNKDIASFLKAVRDKTNTISDILEQEIKKLENDPEEYAAHTYFDEIIEMQKMEGFDHIDGENFFWLLIHGIIGYQDAYEDALERCAKAYDSAHISIGDNGDSEYGDYLVNYIKGRGKSLLSYTEFKQRFKIDNPNYF